MQIVSKEFKIWARTFLSYCCCFSGSYIHTTVIVKHYEALKTVRLFRQHHHVRPLKVQQSIFCYFLSAVQQL